MKDIEEIISTLNPREMKLVNQYFEGSGNTCSSKKNQLLQLAIEKKFSENEIVKSLYKGATPNGSFLKLKQRLKKDLHNIISLKIKPATTEKTTTSSECRRQIANCSTLFNRGLHQEALLLLTKTMSVAVRNELFSEQAMICELFLSENLLRFEKTEKYVNGIFTSLKLQNSLFLVKHLLFEITISQYEGGNPSPLQLNEWSSKLSSLNREIEDLGGSERISSEYHLASMHFAGYMGNIKSMLFHSERLFDIVSRGLAMDCEVSVARASVFLCINRFRNGNTEDFSESLKWINPKLFDEIILFDPLAAEVLFFCYLRDNQPELVKQLITTARKNKPLMKNDFLNCKWTLFKAVAEFNAGSYKDALATLHSFNNPSKRRTHWEIFMYILSIMCAMEISDWDYLAIRVEPLQKTLHRYAVLFEGKEHRLFAIAQILKTLGKNKYNIEKTIKEEKQLLRLMKEGKNGYSWNPAGCEVIRFEKWLESKKGHWKKKGRG